MKALLHHVPTAARILLGLTLVTFGANFYLHFLPQPPMPDAAASFAGALFTSGYVFAIVKPVEIVTGLLLLSNTFVPLALVVLAPVTVGIVGFHVALDPAGGAAALLVLVLHLTLAYAYRRAYAPLFHVRSEPDLGAAHDVRIARDAPQAA